MNSPTARFLAVLAAIAILAAAPGATHARNIDQELLRQAPKLLTHFRTLGYQNVGVLTFRMQHGDDSPTYRSNPISRNLAERLENALVISMDTREPVNIINNASQTAAATIPTANYRTATGRKDLFGIRYPLPLNIKDRFVYPDAFVTGRVLVAPDYSTMTVSFEIFDRRSPESIKRIMQFDVSSDRKMLAELGRGFSLTRISLARGTSLADIRDDVEGVENLTDYSDDNKDLLGKKPFPVKLTVRYDDEPQRLDSSDLSTENFKIKDPSKGQKVEFDVENTTNERLAIVLTVNGVNTLYEEEGDQRYMSRWILEPHKNYRIRGFYQKGNKKYKEIEGKSDEESEELVGTLGDSAGLIHLYVYRSDKQSLGGSQPLVGVSLQGHPGVAVTKTAKNFSDYQKNLADRVDSNIGPKGMMAQGEGSGKADLETGVLDNVIQSDVMIIHYYSAVKN